jgi:hypothetical protein
MSTGAERDEQAELDRLLRRTARDPVHYPPGLVSRSLATVRNIRGLTGDEAFEVAQPGGTLRVARKAITTLVHRMAGELGAAIGGLHVRGVRTDPDGVEVAVAVRYGTPLESADALRDAIAEALSGQLGEQAPPVLVHIADVSSSFE